MHHPTDPLFITPIFQSLLVSVLLKDSSNRVKFRFPNRKFAPVCQFFFFRTNAQKHSSSFLQVDFGPSGLIKLLIIALRAVLFCVKFSTVTLGFPSFFSFVRKFASVKLSIIHPAADGRHFLMLSKSKYGRITKSNVFMRRFTNS